MILAYFRKLSAEFSFKESKITVKNIVSVILFFMLFAPELVYAEASDPRFDILMILPLSGQGAMWGVHTRNGAQLGLASLSPESRNKLGLFFEDDQLNGAKALTAFRAHANTGVDLLVLFGGQSGSALIPLLEKRKILSFTITAKQGLVEATQFAFRHWIDSETQAKLLVPALVSRQLGKVAVFVSTHEATLDMANKFEQQAAEENISIALREEYPPQDKDFRIPISKMKKAGSAEAIVLALLPGQLSAFLRQREELGVELPLYGFSTVENGAELEVAGEAMEGIVYVGPSYSSDFIKKYIRKYGSYPEIAAGNAYDIVLMISQALDRGLRSADEISKYLRDLRKFHGTMGIYGAGDHNDFLLPGSLKTVREGRFQVLSTK